MSTFPISRRPMPDAKKLERMDEDMSRLLPQEVVSAVNLMAHPLAGAAAFSALGIGLASHAFGIWMGALSGAAEMSQRLLSSVGDEMTTGTAPFRRRRGSASERAAPTARALIAGAHSAALERQNASTEHAGSAPASAGVPAGKGATGGGASRHPQKAGRPAAPDDLKAISGIGPKLEKVAQTGSASGANAQIAGWIRRRSSGSTAGAVQWPHRARRLDRSGEKAGQGKAGIDDFGPA